jgi:hypothetical protein
MMTRAIRRFFGFGASTDDCEVVGKDSRSGTFTGAADRVREAFFKVKSEHPEVKSPEEMTDIQRRMQSGSA